MGTRTFTQIAEAASMNDAFRNLQRAAREEYGSDAYNGEINNCELERDVTRQYNEAKNKTKFIEETMHNLENRVAYGITLKEPKSSTNKIKSVVDVNTNKGARVWETRYVVYNSYDESERSIASEKTQGAAIKKARAHTEKTQRRTSVYLEKVLVKGSTSIATVSYKASKTETKGKFLFIVAAPE
jgi:hypothetical protein